MSQFLSYYLSNGRISTTDTVLWLVILISGILGFFLSYLLYAHK